MRTNLLLSFLAMSFLSMGQKGAMSSNMSGDLGNGTLTDFRYLGDRYYDELFIGLCVRNIRASTPNAPYPENHEINKWTGDFFMYKYSMAPGGRRYMFRNKLLGELFVSFGEDFTDVYRDESTGFSQFLAGSHTWAWNAIVTDRFALAAGLNFQDLYVGSSIRTDTTGNGQEVLLTPSPNGWYVGAGPSLFADVMINRYVIAELQFDYAFHVFNLYKLTYGMENDGNPMPHTMFMSLNFVTTWGVYAGVDVSLLNDRHTYNLDTRKIDWCVGYRLML